MSFMCDLWQTHFHCDGKKTTIIATKVRKKEKKRRKMRQQRMRILMMHPTFNFMSDHFLAYESRLKANSSKGKC